MQSNLAESRESHADPRARELLREVFGYSAFSGQQEQIIAADKALYRAKKGGRNQVQAEKRRDPSRPARSSPESKEVEREEVLS